jgi:transposase
VEQKAAAFAAFAKVLNEWRGAGIELVAAIERKDGRAVEFLLEHGVTVYPINPKALDRARDRYRASSSNDDDFDAFVLSQFVRTDHHNLAVLKPDSAQLEELRLLSRDHRALVRQQTRIINQLTNTLKEYYPLALELFPDLEAKSARDFLLSWPTARKASKIRSHTLKSFARTYRLGEKRVSELREKLNEPQIVVPEQVVRAKSRRMLALVKQLDVVIDQVQEYEKEVEDFFAATPAAKLTKTLPVGGLAPTVAGIMGEIGDAPGRWESASHLQATAGLSPCTSASGKRSNGKQARSKRGAAKTQPLIFFRFACNHRLRDLFTQYAFLSLNKCEWARAYYDQQRARGHRHYRALRALGGKWAKIFFAMWSKNTPYNDEHHLASIARHQLRQAA